MTKAWLISLQVAGQDEVRLITEPPAIYISERLDSYRRERNITRVYSVTPVDEDDYETVRENIHGDPDRGFW